MYIVVLENNPILTCKNCNNRDNHDDATKKSLSLTSLLSIFQDTELHQHENSLMMPILKDVLKYEYAPLKQSAVVVMHRLFNNSQGTATDFPHTDND
jgi:hypothetical protein